MRSRTPTTSGRSSARPWRCRECAASRSYLHTGLAKGSNAALDRTSRSIDPAISGADGSPRCSTGCRVSEHDAPSVARAVLATFIDRIPADERRQLLAHLPADARQFAGPPRYHGRPPRDSVRWPRSRRRFPPLQGSPPTRPRRPQRSVIALTFLGSRRSRRRRRGPATRPARIVEPRKARLIRRRSWSGTLQFDRASLMSRRGSTTLERSTRSSWP